MCAHILGWNELRLHLLLFIPTASRLKESIRIRMIAIRTSSRARRLDPKFHCVYTAVSLLSQ